MVPACLQVRDDLQRKLDLDKRFGGGPSQPSARHAAHGDGAPRRISVKEPKEGTDDVHDSDEELGSGAFPHPSTGRLAPADADLPRRPGAAGENPLLVSVANRAEKMQEKASATLSTGPPQTRG